MTNNLSTAVTRMWNDRGSDLLIDWKYDAVHHYTMPHHSQVTLPRNNSHKQHNSTLHQCCVKFIKSRQQRLLYLLTYSCILPFVRMYFL